MRCEGRVEDAVAGHEVVFHLAALVGIPYSYEHPREVMDANVVGTEGGTDETPAVEDYSKAIFALETRSEEPVSVTSTMASASSRR